jgi:hypothetical protein
MRLLIKPANNFDWLNTTFYFLRKHFAVVTALGLVAGFGRVIQLGGFGQITSAMHVALEIVIESARVLLFLYVLGFCDISKGILRIKAFFTSKISRRLHLTAAKNKLKKYWLLIIINFAVFLLIASAINYLIDLVAYETCLYLKLKEDGILSPSSSEWTILLFFKNISVIPFTLVFEAVFLLWLTNKLQLRTIMNHNKEI